MKFAGEMQEDSESRLETIVKYEVSMLCTQGIIGNGNAQRYR